MRKAWPGLARSRCSEELVSPAIMSSPRGILKEDPTVFFDRLDLVLENMRAIFKRKQSKIEKSYSFLKWRQIDNIITIFSALMKLFRNNNTF